ncbi:SIP domain-containing protein [Microbacterium sp. MEC084]|uniref:siderophore-interacting protein n=1 Tax=unclassified Microbacterium TaxID=2609290 RepID=UPI0006F8A2AE|nr:MULTISPECIES: siderophore-interacting protein [unclassified Microbacterium]KQZ04853.1 siderophore-interacting protein [Microbacterium sp. Root53]MCD1267466.1 SIP domain-containing protein [Microbacterium sp. MEC084]
MTTLASTDVRPAYRPHRATVTRVERLSPHFARIEFGGDDLAHFGTAGLDQRIKVLFPFADGSMCDVGQHEDDPQAHRDWYDRWRGLAEHERNPFRTYTVRRIDPDARRLTVDFVVHHDAGPAGSWAEAARVGDQLVVVGPDQRSPLSRVGIDFKPANSSRLLIVGDETAVPAVGSILESLPADRAADVFLEVPSLADTAVIRPPANADLRWIVREQDGGRPDREHGEGLIEAVTAWAAESRDILERAAAPRPQVLADVDVDREILWDSPEEDAACDGEFYAWIAGEAATIKQLRRLLVSGHGVDRRRVAFMGYWRRGIAERTG